MSSSITNHDTKILEDFMSLFRRIIREELKDLNGSCQTCANCKEGGRIKESLTITNTSLPVNESKKKCILEGNFKGEKQEPCILNFKEAQTFKLPAACDLLWNEISGKFQAVGQVHQKILTGNALPLFFSLTMGSVGNSFTHEMFRILPGCENVKDVMLSKRVYQYKVSVKKELEKQHPGLADKIFESATDGRYHIANSGWTFCFIHYDGSLRSRFSF